MEHADQLGHGHRCPNAQDGEQRTQESGDRGQGEERLLGGCAAAQCRPTNQECSGVGRGSDRGEHSRCGSTTERTRCRIDCRVSSKPVSQRAVCRTRHGWQRMSAFGKHTCLQREKLRVSPVAQLHTNMRSPELAHIL